jgi:hypothetical protein
MSKDCQLIVFSNKAYNAIIDETIKKEPIETGGILLGHVLDNGTWIVMETLPPGIYSIHECAYFEYDEAFVNYLANSVASKYEQELSLLGLWHRHPGSMDHFSGTDDGTNAKFASISPCGAISGLVNVDPKFRLTMRHVSSPLRYEIVNFEVGDDIIPDSFFELKHFPKVGLHPEFSQRQVEDEKKKLEINTVPTSEHPSNIDQKTEKIDTVVNTKNKKSKFIHRVKKVLILTGAFTLLYLFLAFGKSIYSGIQNLSKENFKEKVEKTKNKEINISQNIKSYEFELSDEELKDLDSIRKVFTSDSISQEMKQVALKEYGCPQNMLDKDPFLVKLLIEDTQERKQELIKNYNTLTEKQVEILYGWLYWKKENLKRREY